MNTSLKFVLVITLLQLAGAAFCMPPKPPHFGPLKTNENAEVKRVYFDKLSSLDFHQDVRHKIENAYHSLGYEVTYISHPLKRSYVEATEGRLSGLMARVNQPKLKNLIQIPVALKRFEIVLLLNSERCGDCSLETITQLATVSGFVGLQNLLEKREVSIPLFEVSERKLLFNLFLNGRVDAIAVSEVLINDTLLAKQDMWHSQDIGEEFLYHYLHKDFTHLVPQLTQQLAEGVGAKINAEVNATLKASTLKNSIENKN